MTFRAKRIVTDETVVNISCDHQVNQESRRNSIADSFTKGSTLIFAILSSSPLSSDAVPLMAKSNGTVLVERQDVTPREIPGTVLGGFAPLPITEENPYPVGNAVRRTTAVATMRNVDKELRFMDDQTLFGY